MSTRFKFCNDTILGELKQGRPLCGPIIRRSTTQEVYIWVALYIDATLEGTVFNATASETSITPLGKSKNTDVQKSKLGKHLYIYLVKIPQISGGYPVEKLLSYDLKIKKKSILRDKGDDFTYGEYAFPTFILQGKDEELRLLTGSCRKAHGLGEDAMAAMDDQLLVSDKENRPHALFLTGDQIYADDVPHCMLEYLSKLGEELIGQEYTPGIKGGGIGKSYIKPGKRQYYVEEHAGFTSTHAANHLITFGEYAAMYLMAWSPIVWEKFTCTKYSNSKIDSAVQKREIDRTKVYEKSIHQVRRLLANIPTYMMFDDHEITDDWFINNTWKTNVLKKSLGKRIISNGLAAYWAFQGWGNMPEHFPSPQYKHWGNGKKANISLKHIIEKHLEQFWTDKKGSLLRDSYKLRSIIYDAYLSEGVIDAPISNNQRNWSFVAPTQPISLFLDTRTTRGNEVLPLLMDPIIYKYIKKILSPDTKSIKNNGIIIIALTPIWGIEAIESMQSLTADIHKLVKKDLPNGIYSADAESWRINIKSLDDLFKFLYDIEPKICIAISGDVHYGFMCEGNIRLAYKKPSKKVPFIQITSSALKNETYTNPCEGKTLPTKGFNLKKTIDRILVFIKNCTASAPTSKLALLIITLPNIDPTNRFTSSLVNALKYRIKMTNILEIIQFRKPFKQDMLIKQSNYTSVNIKTITIETRFYSIKKGKNSNNKLISNYTKLCKM